MGTLLSLVFGAGTGGWGFLLQFALKWVLPWAIAAAAIGGCEFERRHAARQHEADLQAIGALAGERDRAIGDAKACSEGVQTVQRLEAQRAQQVRQQLQRAETQRRAAEARAQALLNRPPAVLPPVAASPEQVVLADCASAEAVNREQLRARRRP